MPGEYPPGKHPNTIAALKAAGWQPGESGNPAGRPRAGGLSVKEQINTMIDWTPDEVEKVLSDDRATIAKLVAAQILLSAVRGDGMYAKDKKGNLVCVGERYNPGKSFDRIMDRTVGKSPQEILTTGDVTIYHKRTFVEPRKADSDK